MRSILALSLLSIAAPGWCQSPGQIRVQTLLEKAQGTKTRTWANLFIQADAEAARLAIKNASACCGVRHILIPPDYQLTYKWNDIAREEEYQHDLLKVVVHSQEGTPWGANALVILLRDLKASGDAELVPLFKTVLGMTGSPRWHALKDPRLIRIEGEAYETWWSLSKARPDDPTLVDNGAKASDFTRGAEQARLEAIAAYSAVLKRRGDPVLRRRVNDLRAGRDTHQRLWYRTGD